LLCGFSRGPKKMSRVLSPPGPPERILVVERSGLLPRVPASSGTGPPLPVPARHPFGSRLLTGCSDDDSGVHYRPGVETSLGRGQGVGKASGALAVIPGPVVAADGVVMGDGAAGSMQGL